MNFFGEANRHLRLEEEYMNAVRSPNARKVDSKALSNSVSLRKDSSSGNLHAKSNPKVIKSQSRNYLSNDLYANDSVDEIPVQQFIANKWNMEYAKSMNTGVKPRDPSPPSDVSPQRHNNQSMDPSICAKNRGTSYFVAPLNITTNERIIKIQQHNQEFLKNYNKKYM